MKERKRKGRPTDGRTTKGTGERLGQKTSGTRKQVETSDALEGLALPEFFVPTLCSGTNT